ncbi:hypothetical protein cypCar_00016667 [Cyprinus carpio]|nr:hypothetical protein cypCar_00016667 [Cyprinus carpio]
MLFTSPVVVLM